MIHVSSAAVQYHQCALLCLVCEHVCAGFIMSGLSHPDMPDTTGWGTYYTSKGVNKERPALDSLNTQVCVPAQVPHCAACNVSEGGPG
jgi:hypothetical protein